MQILENDVVDEVEIEEPTRPLPWSDRTVLFVFAGLLLMTGMGVFLFNILQIPDDNSAEVGFARDMIVHHEQAVSMALTLYDRTNDERMQTIATDIALTQQAQIGMMMGWLDFWGQTMGGTGPRMVWMGMPTDGLMPGMATATEINRLRELQGVEADILFLQLMIPHHLAGVEMGQALLERSNQPQVRRLAQSIVDSQTAEISNMQQILQEKGAEPVPMPPPMNHEGMDDMP